MKIRNLDEILDEIGDFGRTKNDILDNIFLLSLGMTRTASQRQYAPVDVSCALHTPVNCLLHKPETRKPSCR